MKRLTRLINLQKRRYNHTPFDCDHIVDMDKIKETYEKMDTLNNLEFRHLMDTFVRSHPQWKENWKDNIYIGKMKMIFIIKE